MLSEQLIQCLKHILKYHSEKDEIATPKTRTPICMKMDLYYKIYIFKNNKSKEPNNYE